MMAMRIGVLRRDAIAGEHTGSGVKGAAQNCFDTASHNPAGLPQFA
jgi:hypothetical protein